MFVVRSLTNVRPKHQPSHNLFPSCAHLEREYLSSQLAGEMGIADQDLRVSLFYNDVLECDNRCGGYYGWNVFDLASRQLGQVDGREMEETGEMVVES